MSYHCWCNIDLLAEEVSIRFLHCKVVLSSSPFHIVLFGGKKSLCVANTWMQSDASPLWGWGTHINYLGFCCTGDLFLLPPPPAPVSLLKHLFVSVWTHGYLFYTSHHNPILPYFVAQIVTALALGSSFRLLYLPNIDHHCIVWVLPYFLAVPDPPGLSCIFPDLVLESTILTQYWEMVLETKTWMLGVLIATGVSLLLVPFS